MKIFSKLWWVFGVVGTIAAFLNPYIGFFGFINASELFIMFCLNINIVLRVKELKKSSEDNLLKVSTKQLCNSAYIVAIIFFLFKLLVVGTIFIVAYSTKDPAAPYQIWTNPDKISILCLVVEMIFNMLLLISFMQKGKITKRMVTKDEYIKL